MQIGNLIYNKKYINEMKHIKLFESFQEKVYTLSELYPIEQWIESVWERLGKVEEEKLPEFFQEIEDCCGEEAAEIIDQTYSADHLHYYQNGSMGLDTGEFIENFDNIKNDVEEILKNYID